MAGRGPRPSVFSRGKKAAMGRPVRALIVLTLALAGCQFPIYIVQNISYEITQCWNDTKECKSIRRSAAAAWQDFICGPNASGPYSEDFHAGFIDGFSYYVLRGGDGEPPAVPPHCYWKESYRTPDGAVCVQDWFNGYRQGTQIAREGHYRERELLPLSRPLQEESTGARRQPDAIELPFPQQVR